MLSGDSAFWWSGLWNPRCFAAWHSTHVAFSLRVSQREHTFPLCGLLSYFNWWHTPLRWTDGLYHYAMHGWAFSLRLGAQEYDNCRIGQSQEKRGFHNKRTICYEQNDYPLQKNEYSAKKRLPRQKNDFKGRGHGAWAFWKPENSRMRQTPGGVFCKIVWKSHAKSRKWVKIKDAIIDTLCINDCVLIWCR